MLRLLVEGLRFIKDRPALFILHAAGWLPDLVLMFFTFLWGGDIVHALANPQDIAALASVTVRLSLALCITFPLHLVMATIITGTSTVFVREGLHGTASLGGAFKDARPRMSALFLAKAALWLVGFLLSAVSAAFALPFFATQSMISVIPLAIGLAILLGGTIVLAMVNNFLAPAVVEEGLGAVDALSRAWRITLDQLAPSFGVLVVSQLVGLIFLLLSMSLGPIVGNIVAIVPATYFVVVWLLIYFEMERRQTA